MMRRTVIALIVLLPICGAAENLSARLATLEASVKALQTENAKLSTSVDLLEAPLDAVASVHAGPASRESGLRRLTSSGTNQMSMKYDGQKLIVDSGASFKGDLNVSGNIVGGTVSGCAFGSALFHARETTTAPYTEYGSAGDWTLIRRLNAVVTNEIGASLTNYAITLDAGTYFVMASAIGRKANQHQARLATDGGTTLVLGTNEYTSSESTRTFVNGRFTLTSQTDVVLNHWIGTMGQTSSTLGYCLIPDTAEDCVLTEVMIWKL